jgi:ketosteroid isomerase-like protein
MGEVSRAVTEFFEAYERATQSLDSAFLGSAYAETFMFAGPRGIQAVKRDDFLKVIPKRKAFFQAVGLISSRVQRLDETHLDEQHAMVSAHWTLRFEKDPGPPITDEIAATYLLRREADLLQIVFQLDHQDLAERVKDLGLVD